MFSVTATAVPPCFWFCPVLVFPCHCLHLCLVHCLHLCVVWFCVFRFLFCVQSLSCHCYCPCYVSTLSVSPFFGIKNPFVKQCLASLLRLGPTPPHTLTVSFGCFIQIKSCIWHKKCCAATSNIDKTEFNSWVKKRMKIKDFKMKRSRLHVWEREIKADRETSLRKVMEWPAHTHTLHDLSHIHVRWLSHST